ncbi:unnamed protein product [Coregonus sp. 'balchen']|nr:unnamed protein product [Coregonus sp. 'balchen']
MSVYDNAPVDEPHMDRTPPPPPRTRVPNTTVDTQPALPMRNIPQPPPEIRSGHSSDDHEDPDQVYPKPKSVNMADRDVFLPVPGWGKGKGRCSSLCSDDELLDDDNEPISSL